ncbi:MAG: hypothetical protein KTR32_21710 [Granulosicoccus sp.]|nr:hypothetical protein [Granulosicoccus sp.]
MRYDSLKKSLCRHQFVVLLLPLFLLGCMTNPAQPDGPDVRGQWRDSFVKKLSGSVTPLRVAIVETDIEVVLHRVVDDPQWLMLEQHKISRAIDAALHAAVRSAGLRVRSSTAAEDHLKVSLATSHSSPKSTGTLSELRFQASRLIDNHARLAALGESGEFPSLGRQVLRLSEPLNADLVLVSRYRGWRKTAGQWRKERVSSSLLSIASLGSRRAQPVKQFGELEMLLFDGVNGDLLWRGYITGAPNSVVSAIVEAFTGCGHVDCSRLFEGQAN